MWNDYEKLWQEVIQMKEVVELDLEKILETQTEGNSGAEKTRLEEKEELTQKRVPLLTQWLPIHK